MAYDPSYQGTPPPQGNPGQALGIVSIVLGLTCGLSLFGLIAGFVSRRRSKRARASPALGTIGLAISAVGLVFLVAGGAVLAVGAIAVSERCEGVGSGGTYEEGGVTFTCP